MFYASLIVDSRENEKTRWRSKVLWASAKLTLVERPKFSLSRDKKKKSHHFVEVIAQSGNEENMEIHARQTQRSERDNEKQML